MPRPYNAESLRTLTDDQRREIFERTGINRESLEFLSGEPQPISETMFAYFLKYCKTYIRNSGVTSIIAYWINHEWIISDIKVVIHLVINRVSIYLGLSEEENNIYSNMSERGSDHYNTYRIDRYLIEKAPTLVPLTEEELNSPFMRATFNMNENSRSLEILENVSRFSGATWFEAIQDKTIILAGLGGIGSYVCFLLARVRPLSLFLYDDDRVEAANMSGQLYGLNDINKYKVDAISDMVKEYADYNSVFATSEKFTENSEAADIMICGFDSMSARQCYFNKWASHIATLPEEHRKRCLFIDGRLAAEYLQVFCFTGDDRENIAKYRDTELFQDYQADNTQCSYKQTTYMANMIGSIIVNLFTNFVANEVADAPIRDLPYLSTYDGNTMQLKTE